MAPAAGLDYEPHDPERRDRLRRRAGVLLFTGMLTPCVVWIGMLMAVQIAAALSPPGGGPNIGVGVIGLYLVVGSLIYALWAVGHGVRLLWLTRR